MGRPMIDLTGQRFGRLVVIKRVKPAESDIAFPNTSAYWLCKCDCGNETIVVGSALRSGNTKSCGCYRSEWGRKCMQRMRAGEKL